MSAPLTLAEVREIGGQSIVASTILMANTIEWLAERMGYKYLPGSVSARSVPYDEQLKAERELRAWLRGEA